MENETPLKQMIDEALSKVGSVADVNTVVGEPKILPNGTVIVPFSKVSVGFASGGSDFDGKKPDPEKRMMFAGGSGAGISVIPLGFLVIDENGVRMLDLKNPDSYAQQNDPVSKIIDGFSGIIDKTPELVEKIKGLKKKKINKDEPATTAEAKPEHAE